MKILRTLVLISTILFAGMLWFTRAEWLPSQSAFALSDNVIWYYMMHFSIMLTFLLDEKGKWLSILGAIATFGIVIYDMYNYPLLHNIMTGTMAAIASASMIYYASTKERPTAIMNVGVGALCFLLGLWVWDFHLFFGEVIIEATIGVAMVRRIWIDE